MKSSSVVTSDPVYVFDLDGVITNPHNSRVDKRVLEKIILLLRKDKLVAVNTGRSYEWVKENLNNYLAQQGDTDILRRYIAVCEMGGETIVWADDAFVLRLSQFALSDDAHKRAHEIFQLHSAKLDTMFWDETKRTMATLEKHPAADLAAFRRQQRVISDLLREGLDGFNVRIGTPTIAIDITSPQAGKHAGAELIYEYVLQRSPSRQMSFISIGDSPGDYEMARYFAEQGAISTFVYVGDVQSITPHKEVNMLTTRSRFAEGALEFLDGVAL